jgi:hypothetical protein
VLLRERISVGLIRRAAGGKVVGNESIFCIVSFFC